jgi:flotillin
MQRNNVVYDKSGLTTEGKLLFTGLVGLGIAGFALTRYKTSKSNEWLVRTGLGIKDIQIGKKYVQWPFQNIDYINMAPSSFKFSINAMSKEKMEFNFPAVFTIGPKNNPESLTSFSRYLLGQDNDEVNDLIRGIIEGETRSMSANLAIEEIFAGRTEFKKDIVDNVQKQLDQYGLEIFNANIEELKDGDQSNYFKSLSQRIKSEAENRAKTEVAEQNKKGDIGVKEREGETRQQISIIEADTTLVENQRQQQILKSQAELEKTRAEQNLIITQAKIKADNEALIKRMEMEKEVEIKRSHMELEKQRATDFSTIQVKAEIEAKKAEGDANSKKIMADADLYAKQKEAEANLYAKKAEAEGVEALYRAQAEGLNKLVASFGGNSQALISYTMLEKGIYEKLAGANAEAIKGLNPKITVWTHDPNQAFNTVQNLSKSVIPMLDTIQEQTNFKLPDFLLQQNKDVTK